MYAVMFVLILSFPCVGASKKPPEIPPPDKYPREITPPEKNRVVLNI